MNLTLIRAQYSFTILKKEKKSHAALMIFECVLEKKKNRWAARGSDEKKREFM